MSPGFGPAVPPRAPGDLLVPGSLPPRPHHEPGGDQPPAADARPAGPGPTAARRRLRTTHSWPSTTGSSGRPAGCPSIRASTALRYARQFLDRHFGDDRHGPRPTCGRPTSRTTSDATPDRLKPGSVAVLASSLRSFFRFLALSHGFDPSLAGVVPTAPQWPMDRLPKSLADEDLRAVLRHFDDRHRDRPPRPGDDAVHERPGAPRRRGRRLDPRRHRLAARGGDDPRRQGAAGSRACRCPRRWGGRSRPISATAGRRRPTATSSCGTPCRPALP